MFSIPAASPVCVQGIGQFKFLLQKSIWSAGVELPGITATIITNIHYQVFDLSFLYFAETSTEESAQMIARRKSIQDHVRRFQSGIDLKVPAGIERYGFGNVLRGLLKKVPRAGRLFSKSPLRRSSSHCQLAGSSKAAIMADCGSPLLSRL